MYMVAVYVLVLEYKIRHIAEPHLFHILVGKAGKVNIRKPVVRVRIERYVHHRLFGFGIGRHPPLEILKRTVYVDSPCSVVEDFVGVEQPAFLLVYLFAVVNQSSVKGVA